MGSDYSVVSLFSGAGGLDMGFENQGFRIIWANDLDHDACETHRHWSNANVVEGDIGQVAFSSIPASRVILGGFPCQGFSLAGPRKIDDSRNTLYRYFVKLVAAKQPDVFVAENVKGLLTLGNGKIIDAIEEDFRSIGYRVTHSIVNAADYQVPQDRVRVFIVGIHSNIPGQFTMPDPFPQKKTLRDALARLPAAVHSDVCSAPYSSRYMSRNRKRGWEEQSFTIPAMAKQIALHPASPDMIKRGTDEWIFGKGETRRLSYKEAAAIQTFPPTMEFFGDLTSKYRQIGNAVPVKLAEVVANEVKRILDHNS